MKYFQQEFEIVMIHSTFIFKHLCDIRDDSEVLDPPKTIASIH